MPTSISEYGYKKSIFETPLKKSPPTKIMNTINYHTQQS